MVPAKQAKQESARLRSMAEEAKDQRERDRAMKERHDYYNKAALQVELNELRTRFAEMEERNVQMQKKNSNRNRNKIKKNRDVLLTKIENRPRQHPYLGGLPGQTVYEYQLRGAQRAEYGFQEQGLPVFATANLAGLDDAAALLGFASQRVPLVFV
jgi:hypothetical protein